MELAGKTLSIEIGKLAEQANGTCTVKYGDTFVFVAATASEQPREGIDYFPLSVNFEERLYSVGRIPGGFIKREGRPTEKAILTSRLIDRPIRPLFPEGYRNDVSIYASAHSIDPEYPPEVYAMIGSSLALSISDIPFEGPTGSVVVGMVDGEYVINPNSQQREKSTLELVVSGTKDAIMMVEAGANEISEGEMLEAILLAHDYIKQIVEFQETIIAEVAKPKLQYTSYLPEEQLDKQVREYAYEKVAEAVKVFDREERSERTKAVTEEVQKHFGEIFPEQSKEIDSVLYNITEEVVRNRIIKEGIRPDGRGMTEVRNLSSEVGTLPRTHGSGLFSRGQTQVLTVCTLGPLGDMQFLDGLWEEESKRYIHHYNFPSFSVGETRPSRGPGRREIGHGHLAERALEPIIPGEDEFPYTIRLVSEVLSSNGSSSQASVCGSTLALMDAGVPIKSPVAGIAMGLIKDETSDEIAILTDIQGLEDFLGDMDFKIAGTKKGITAIQMDIKIKGIDRQVLESALEQARIGRLEIMDNMLQVIPEHRESLSPYAPKIIQTTINPDKIRDVIGAGGKVINKIIEDTGVKIDIEDDGRVYIASTDHIANEKALKIIEGIVKEVEVGEVYTGKVMRILNFGAFVEFLPGKEGMVHISKLAHRRVEKVEDVVKVGDDIAVKVIEVDNQGRINLSHKDTLPPPTKDEKEQRENKPPRKKTYNQRRDK